jgi:uroporphyrinogen decarboxylase
MGKKSGDYRFLKACRKEEVDCTPVWMMRQAGRYLEKYRKLREKHSFLEMCKTPELAVEVTLQPFELIDLDAAILYSDILIPVEAMGIDLEFIESRGPVIHNPVRTEKDVRALRVIDPRESVPFVMESIKILRKELEGRAPLIGFSGVPFTLASYMIEGGGSKNYLEAKSMMYNAPELFHELMQKITDTVIRYLNAQVDAGAQAIQVFDSWVGALSPLDYKNYVLPYSKQVLDGIKGSVPKIHFGTGTAGFLDLLKEAGGDVIGVDWRIDLDRAWKILGDDVGVQGNFDSSKLFGTKAVIEEAVKDILQRAENRPGHIFNLGHGIQPKTPPENAAFMVDKVHELSKR